MNVTRKMLLGIALAIFAGTLWLYWPSTHGGYLRVDDEEYLRQAVQWKGLTWGAVKWAFTCTDSYYHPLPRLSHVLDYQLWGRNPAGHHATSVIVHAFNAALVFGFLWTLLGATFLNTSERLSLALWVTAVFAIHPLQTESVAWMSGRTQLLCVTFGISSLWAYTAGARRWFVWTLFVLALLSKPMAVSFPFVMLAIDYFPLRRQKLGWKRLLLEKAALIGTAGVAAVATIIASQSREHASLVPAAVVPLSVRVLRVFESLTFYLVKLVWPSHLSPNYLLDQSFSQSTVLLSVFTILVITVLVVYERQRIPMLAAGWWAYVLLLLPVSGLITTGRPVVELRYAYVAMIPLLLVAGVGLVWVWRHSRRVVRAVVVGLLASELCAFAADTRRLIPDWHDDEAMRRATVAEFPNSEQANRELAMELLDQDRATEAVIYAQRDTEVAPQDSEAHVMLALVLCKLSRPQEAMEQAKLALQINSNSAPANLGLGTALEQMGRVGEAIQHYEDALRLDPHFIDAHMSLGNALLVRGQPLDAIAHYQQVLQIKPDTPGADYAIGYALYQMGRVPEAIKEFEAALQIWPGYAEAHNSLGSALLSTGDLQSAIAQYNEALQLKPDYAEAHANLGLALLKAGRIPEAIGQYEEALRISPGDVKAHYNLALALAREGQSQEAIDHFQQALRIKPDYVEAHFNLGLTLEKMGRTPEAIEQYEQALKLRPDFTPAAKALARLHTSQ